MGKKSSSNHPTQKKKKVLFFVKSITITFLTAALFLLVTYSIRTIVHTPPCANTKSCTSDRLLHIDNKQQGFFEGKIVNPPQISDTQDLSPVLGVSTAKGEKHIYVDLSSQTLYAFQGSTLFLKTLISSGKWTITPTGNFAIWEKLRSTRMTGGEGDDAYDLPNVPYVMYFYNDFGLHGAYWHDNFGHPMSHGCINMRETDAKVLYEWADGPSGDHPGTAVSICDQITKNYQCIQNNPVQ